MTILSDIQYNGFTLILLVGVGVIFFFIYKRRKLRNWLDKSKTIQDRLKRRKETLFTKKEFGTKEKQGEVKHRLTEARHMIVDFTRRLTFTRLLLLMAAAMVLSGLGFAYLFDKFTNKYEAYGMITVGGQETNFTDYSGGREIYITLTEYDVEGKKIIRNASVFVDYTKKNITRHTGYTVFFFAEKQMTNLGGMIKNKLIYDIKKEQERRHEGDIIMMILTCEAIALGLVNSAGGHRLGQQQSLWRR